VRSQPRKFNNSATIDPLSGKSKGKERKEKGRKEPVVKKFYYLFLNKTELRFELAKKEGVVQ
jgi:hypothetical protein